MKHEELLAHANFVRTLARYLVLDEHRAADVEQQTWLTALEHPPSTGKPVRAWLSKIARNFARMTYRNESRRRRHERAAVHCGHTSASHDPGHMPTPDEVVAQGEIGRCLYDAVLGLDEPYCSTILYRFYRDMTPTEIARRLQVPVDTVKTRLKRGLAQLRQKLDTQHGGDRRKWLIAIAPIAGVKMGGEAGAASGASGSLLGILFMSAKIKVAATAALVFGAMLAIWLVIPKEQDSDISQANVNLTSKLNRNDRTPLGNEMDEDISPIEKEVVAPTSMEVIWRGRVIEYNGMPREGVAINPRLSKAFHLDEKSGNHAVVESKEGGSFEIAGLVPGEYTLHLSFTRTGNRPNWYEWGKVTLEAPGVIEKDILVAEGNGAIVAGVVVDEASGQPFRRRVRPPSGFIDFYVVLYNIDFKGDPPVAEVDPERGTFCMRNLPPMTFDLYLMGPGIFRKILPSFVNTSERKIIDDIRLSVPPLGALRIMFSGFSKREIRHLDIDFELEWTSSPYPINFFKEDHTIPMPEGKGRIIFSHKTLGSIARLFEIRYGEVFEITVCQGDFSFYEAEPIDVKGTLKRSDGSLLAGATVAFQKKIEYLPNFARPDYRAYA